MLKQTERDLNAELNEIIKKEKETNKQEIEKLIRENSITKGFQLDQIVEKVKEKNEKIID